MQEEKISHKVSKGIMWITLSTVLTRIFGIIIAIILARLLMPSDFGIMAIVMAIMAFSQQTTQTGFESALIQRQGDLVGYLSTAWTFELFRYILLAIILFFTAPLFTAFFKVTNALTILRVICIALIIYGFRNIGIVYFKKELDFKKQFFFEVIPFIVHIFFVIPFAFLLRNVWALVIAEVIRSASVTILSYVLHPFRPKFFIDIQKAKKLFNFGKWILGSSLIVLIREHGISMFVGRLFSIDTLGFFNRGSAFSIKQFRQINSIVWRVGYPFFSKIQDNREKLKEMFLRTLQMLTFVTFPIIGILFLLSYDFVHLILTDKWIRIVPLIKLFCLQSMLMFINTPTTIIFQAIGRPSIGTKNSGLGLLALLVMVYPLSTLYGISGTVISLVFVDSFVVFLILIKSKQYLGWSYFEFIKYFSISLLSFLIMCVSIVIIKRYMLIEINLMNFTNLILIGIATFIGSSFLFDKFFNMDFYHSLWNIIQNFKNSNLKNY